MAASSGDGETALAAAPALPERRDQAASDTEKYHQKDCGAAHERLERRVIGQTGKLGVRRILGIDKDADLVTGLVKVRARDVDDGDVPPADRRVKPDRYMRLRPFPRSHVLADNCRRLRYPGRLRVIGPLVIGMKYHNADAGPGDDRPQEQHQDKQAPEAQFAVLAAFAVLAGASLPESRVWPRAGRDGR